MTRLIASALVLSIPAAVLAQAPNQVLFLTDGTQVTGVLVGVGGNQITIRDSDQRLRRFTFDQLESINFNAPVQSNRFDRPDQGQRPGTFRDQPSDQGNYAGRSYMGLSAGSEISVRTNEMIDSGSGSQDRAFSAQVARDVADGGGNILIPRGSQAWLVVRNIGNNRIALDLQSVTVNGRLFVVNSEDITKAGRQGVGENKRTAEFVGGGAVLGTLLGAIAGGGKGAAIGALAGGGAGVAAEVLTKGDRVHVAAETILSFRLDQAVNLDSRN